MEFQFFFMKLVLIFFACWGIWKLFAPKSWQGKEDPVEPEEEETGELTERLRKRGM